MRSPLSTVFALPITFLCSIFLNPAYAWNPLTGLGNAPDIYHVRPHWYAGANLGVSHLFDKKIPGSTNHVNQNGPGWNVDGGYQFNHLLGLEGGFTQYHYSRETLGTTTFAQTEHYAIYLAATLQLYLFDRLSALGKLGAAYSYANKIFNTGPSASSGAVAPYLGLGFSYKMTQIVDFVAQWGRAYGNNATGSSDLYSIGLNFAIV